MAVSKEFLEAVDKKNYRRIKLMMKNSITYDPTCLSFDEMMGIVEEKAPEIIDEHDGEALKPSKDWTKEYYNEQIVHVMDNFSIERIGLLKDMSRTLFANENDRPRKENAQSSNLNSQNEISNKTINKSSFLIALLTCIGALAVLIGAMKGAMPLVIAGAVVLLVDIICFFAMKKENKT